MTIRYPYGPTPKVLISDVPLPLMDLTLLLFQHNPKGEVSPLLPSRPNQLSHNLAFGTVRVPLYLDLALCQIIPYIDGIRSVRQIAVSSMVDERFVKSCVRHLLHFEFIRIIDIFDMSNIYVLRSTFNLNALFISNQESSTTIPFLIGGHQYLTWRQSNGLPLPSMGLISHLYRSFPISDDNEEYTSSSVPPTFQYLFYSHFKDTFIVYGISLRHFITFGFKHGFLRRLHEYPLIVQSSILLNDKHDDGIPTIHDNDSDQSSDWNSQDIGGNKLFTKSLLSLANGQHHIDYITTLSHQFSKCQTIQSLLALASKNHYRIEWVFK